MPLLSGKELLDYYPMVQESRIENEHFIYFR
jgi:hypothetical protein